MLRAAYIDLSFDAARLAAETHAASAAGWTMHFNRRDYEGEWSGIALRSNSPAGRNPLYVDQSGTPFRDTDTLDGLPYLQQCLKSLPFAVLSARLLKLAPGAVILEHRDRYMSIDYDEARFHVPILTNDATEFVVADAPLVFAPGECWYINVDLPHRIANRGPGDRIHLVVDAVVTPELRARVHGAARRYEIA